MIREPAQRFSSDRALLGKAGYIEGCRYGACSRRSQGEREERLQKNYDAMAGTLTMAA
jgi:hypothetical protein